MTFRDAILKRHSKKECKVRNSITTKQIWRWFKKNKFFNLPELSEKDFGQLIADIHKIFINNFLTGHSIKLPKSMGVIELRKLNIKLNIVDGKVVTNRPVDWDRTLTLWENDEEALNNKTLIRSEINTKFKIFYNKGKAIYKNKRYIKFSPNRFFKIALKEKINNNEIDSCYEIC